MKFKKLPLLVKIAVVLTFFNTWVMFEEFVIDRFGYWHYLPFYKKGIFCPWDITFILIVSIMVFFNWSYIKSKCFITNCLVCN
jgi:hypothetical protein